MSRLLDRVVGRDLPARKGPETEYQHGAGPIAVDPITAAMAQEPASSLVTIADGAPKLGAQGDANQKPFRTLVLDGGGINGLAQAKALAALERETGKPISEQFDFMVGTSTGGLIALAMAARHPNDPNRPLMTAAELVDFYEQQGPGIFGTRDYDNSGARWDAGPLEDFLKQKFGNTRIQDTRVPVMVSAYDSEKGEAVWLKNLGAGVNLPGAPNPLLWQAARATSAAPTKFLPIEVGMGDGPNETRRRLVDGGVFANMPAMPAYAMTKKILEAQDSNQKIEMLSIGTSGKDFTMSAEKIASTTGFGWAIDLFKKISPIREINELGKETSANYLLTSLLGDRYHRWDIPLAHDLGKKFSPTGELDDASPRNIEKLKFVGEQFIAKNWQRISTLADRLAPGRVPGATPELADRASLTARLKQASPPSPGLLAILGFGRKPKDQTLLASGPDAPSRLVQLESSTSPAALRTGLDRAERAAPRVENLTPGLPAPA